MSRLNDIKIKVWASELLKSMKGKYTYQWISDKTGLRPSTISRYVRGIVLPNLKRAQIIIDFFIENILFNELTRSIRIESRGVVDLSNILSNINLLKLVTYSIAPKFIDKGINCVLTKEADGIPLATLFSMELNACLAVAKRTKEPGPRRFIEASQHYLTGLYTYIYVPRNIIKRKAKVLIVDDMIRSGSTVLALSEIIKSAKADLVGIFSIISLESGIFKIKKELKIEPLSTLIIDRTGIIKPGKLFPFSSQGG